MKVNKSKRSSGKLVPLNPPPRLKAVLPVLIKLKNIQNVSLSEMLDILSHITDKESHRMLTPVEKGELIAYLTKYGYNSDFLKEGKDENTEV